MIKFGDLGPTAQEALARLTDAQRVFVKHLFEGESQTAAYRIAYPTNKSPSGCATELAKKADIKVVLEELRILAAREFCVDEERIIGAYAELAFSDIRNFYHPDGSMIPVGDLPRHVANTILSFEQEEIMQGSGEDRRNVGVLSKVRLINRKDALDSLARTQGLFITDKKKKKEDAAKVVRFPAPVSKGDWQKQNGKA